MYAKAYIRSLLVLITVSCNTFILKFVHFKISFNFTSFVRLLPQNIILLFELPTSVRTFYYRMFAKLISLPKLITPCMHTLVPTWFLYTKFYFSLMACVKFHCLLSLNASLILLVTVWFRNTGIFLLDYLQSAMPPINKKL